MNRLVLLLGLVLLAGCGGMPHPDDDAIFIQWDQDEEDQVSQVVDCTCTDEGEASQIIIDCTDQGQECIDQVARDMAVDEQQPDQ